MFSFFSPKTELGVVFHIGTSSVGAGLLRLKPGESPTVLYTLREPIPYRENILPERFLADMLETLKIVNLRLAKDGFTHLKFTEFGGATSHYRAKHVFYVFSSPWTMSQTKTVSFKESIPFTITEGQVKSIIDAEEKKFESEIWNGGTAMKSHGLQVIEKRIIDIRLNGYQVTEPYGKLAHTADISFFTSLMPKAIFEKVTEISAQTYHARDTKIFSFALASFSVIRDAFPEYRDFIFLDIGGELSDVAIVKDGLILETGSFPLGRHFIVRKIAKFLNATPEEAISLVRIYEEGRADKILEEKLKPVLNQAIKEWMDGFHTALGKVGDSASLPTKLFVVINNDFVQLFMRALRSEKISEFGIAELPLHVTLVNHDKLKGLVSFGKHADKDLFIAIIAAFAGKVYN